MLPSDAHEAVPNMSALIVRRGRSELLDDRRGVANGQINAGMGRFSARSHETPAISSEFENYASQPARDGSWIKRATRIEGSHHGVLVDSAGRRYAVTVVDISSRGFKLHTDETFRIGECVGLQVSRYGEFSGQIRWALGKNAGGVFLNPIVLPPSEG